MKEFIIILTALVLCFFTPMVSLPSASALGFEEHESRAFLATSNDKFSLGISHDLYTASFESHIQLRYVFFDLELNSFTNRGFTAISGDASSFVSGRYDEIYFRAGTDLSLIRSSAFSLNLLPATGFSILGDFGMETFQNNNHKRNNVPAVHLDYDTFAHPFAPSLDVTLKAALPFSPLFQADINLTSRNTVFYQTKQELRTGFTFGREKTSFSAFAGYDWSQPLVSSSDSRTALLSFESQSGPVAGFVLDTGIARFEYTGWFNSYGYGTINVDVLNALKSRWSHSDAFFSTGVSHLIDTEFLINQIGIPYSDWLSFIFTNRYVSGFKKNDVHPALQERFERDYAINTLGIRAQYTPEFLAGWLSPYAEVSGGVATYIIRKLSNHIPGSSATPDIAGNAPFAVFDITAGLSLIPDGTLCLGSGSLAASAFVSALITPSYKKASELVRKDMYRSNDWNMKAVEFSWGIMVRFGLDF